MLRGLTTVVYQADDLAEATSWYSELLGVEPYFVRLPWYMEFRIGDYQHELGIVSSEGAAMLRADTGSEAAGAGAVAYWYVDDIEAAYQRLLALGATEYHPPREFGEGYIGAAVRDPFGNILGIMYNQHYLDVLGRIPAFELPEVEPVVIENS